MEQPKHQHFIRRSFLRQFAMKNENGKYMVDTLMRGKNEQVKTLSTTQVCVQTNIYTFPIDTEGDRYTLEKQYAVEVDAVYPEVYRMLVDKDISDINREQKAKILNTILSLYFRTPFFLNEQNRQLDGTSDKISAFLGSTNKRVRYKYEDGRIFTLTSQNLEDIRSELKIEKKKAFLEQHLKEWKEFIKYKLVCGLEVIEVSDEVPLISSDNPVLILGERANPNPSNIFHPDNIIQVAIDPRHYLIIYPNKVSEEEFRKILRSTRDKYFAAGLNMLTQELSDGRVLGYPGHIHKHFESQRQLGEHSPENVHYLENFIKSTELMADLTITIKPAGDDLLNHKVISKVKILRESGKLEGDKSFESILDFYRERGVDL